MTNKELSDCIASTAIHSLYARNKLRAAWNKLEHKEQEKFKSSLSWSIYEILEKVQREEASTSPQTT